MSESNDQVKGRDLDAPVEQVTIDGEHYALRFNNHAGRVAEDVYEEQYGRDVGYGYILQKLARGKLAAVMAVFYGAMVAGGGEMQWDEFDEKFRLLDSIDGLREVLLRGVQHAMPAPKAGDKPTP